MQISTKYFNIIILTILVIGILLRIFHFVQNNSFYGDEVALYNNIKNNDFGMLLKNLDFVQACPVFFLIFSKFMYELIKSSTQYNIDLFLRILPLTCSIVSIFVFYKFMNLILINKSDKIIAFTLFTLNTQCIAYSAIFKQYSLELFISLILFIISYNIIFKNIIKLKDIIFISISLWFSFSSIFLTIPLLIFLMFKNIKDFFKVTIPYIVNFFILFIVSLKDILNKTLFEMNSCWDSLDFGYLSFIHPYRNLIRFGEFFVYGASSPYKIITAFIGLLIILALISFIFNKKCSTKVKSFILIPILFVFSASIMKMYPVVVRLILFLYPLFVIIITSYSFKYKKLYLYLMIMITIISSLYYVPNLKLTNPDSRNYIEYNKGYLNLKSKEEVLFVY